MGDQNAENSELTQSTSQEPLDLTTIMPFQPEKTSPGHINTVVGLPGLEGILNPMVDVLAPVPIHLIMHRGSETATYSPAHRFITLSVDETAFRATLTKVISADSEMQKAIATSWLPNFDVETQHLIKTTQEGLLFSRMDQDFIQRNLANIVKNRAQLKQSLELLASPKVPDEQSETQINPETLRELKEYTFTYYNDYSKSVFLNYEIDPKTKKIVELISPFIKAHTTEFQSIFKLNAQDPLTHEVWHELFDMNIHTKHRTLESFKRIKAAVSDVDTIGTFEEYKKRVAESSEEPTTLGSDLYVKRNHILHTLIKEQLPPELKEDYEYLAYMTGLEEVIIPLLQYSQSHNKYFIGRLKNVPASFYSNRIVQLPDAALIDTAVTAGENDEDMTPYIKQFYGMMNYDAFQASRK